MNKPPEKRSRDITEVAGGPFTGYMNFNPDIIQRGYGALALTEGAKPGYAPFRRAPDHPHLTRALANQSGRTQKTRKLPPVKAKANLERVALRAPASQRATQEGQAAQKKERYADARKEALREANSRNPSQKAINQLLKKEQRKK